MNYQENQSLDLPTGKAVFRARQDYQTTLNEADEDYRRSVYRSEQEKSNKFSYYSDRSHHYKCNIANEDHRIKLKRAKEKLFVEVNRSTADGLDLMYKMYSWKYDKFCELRTFILDHVNKRIRSSHYKEALDALEYNNFDYFAYEYFNVKYRSRISLSQCLREAAEYVSGSLSETTHDIMDIQLVEEQIKSPPQSSKRKRCDSDDSAW